MSPTWPISSPFAYTGRFRSCGMSSFVSDPIGCPVASLIVRPSVVGSGPRFGVPLVSRTGSAQGESERDHPDAEREVEVGVAVVRRQEVRRAVLLDDRVVD